MKIKSKLIAGGLMSVVACGLVGSITGTFAWYQISNRSTVSMHGVSIGSSQSLELKTANMAQYSSANVTWADIAGVNADSVELTPVSNGANNGSRRLNDTWYGNPIEGADQLPVVTEGYYSFTMYARYAEYVSDTATFPAANLYVTDFGVKEIVNNAADAGFALRMHVQFGTGDTAVYFLVNPYEPIGVNLELSSNITDRSNDYDWETPAQETKIGLPVGATGEVGHEFGVLSTLDHDDVLAALNEDGTLADDEDRIEYSIPTDGVGVQITVTFWLEGFAQQDNDDEDSDWWEEATTIASDLQFGMQLYAEKVSA